MFDRLRPVIQAPIDDVRPISTSHPGVNIQCSTYVDVSSRGIQTPCGHVSRWESALARIEQCRCNLRNGMLEFAKAAWMTLA